MKQHATLHYSFLPVSLSFTTSFCSTPAKKAQNYNVESKDYLPGVLFGGERGPVKLETARVAARLWGQPRRGLVSAWRLVGWLDLPKCNLKPLPGSLRYSL